MGIGCPRPNPGWQPAGAAPHALHQLLTELTGSRASGTEDGAGDGRGNGTGSGPASGGNTGTGPEPTIEPQLTVIAGLSALLGAPGALPGRFADGTSLPRESVQRLGCGGALTAVLLDAAGRPVGASGTHRTATTRERRALRAQWGRWCAVQGCDRPGTIPHHAAPWWLTHRTRLADLVPLCPSSHHDLHEGGRTLRLRDGRHINPTGWTQGPPP